MAPKGFRSSGPDSLTRPGLKVIFPNTHVNAMPHVTDRPVAGYCGRFKRENMCGDCRSEGKLSVQPDVGPACCSPSGWGGWGGLSAVSALNLLFFKRQKKGPSR